MHNCFAFVGKLHFCKSYVFSVKTQVVAAWYIIVAHLLGNDTFAKAIVLSAKT